MTGSVTQASAARLVGRGRAFHPDRRTLSAGALGATLVLSVGLTDGGYYGRETTVLTLAFAAVALLGAMHGGRLSRAGTTALGALSALLAWTALSGSWAVPGALVEQEARRALLYATALAALLLAVDHGRRGALLLGLAAGISALGLVAVGVRAASGEVVDRFYGTLLEEPVGYPNALGVLAAVGVVIGVGLEHPGIVGRALRGSAAFLVFVLGLSGSRGAALALAVALGVLVALSASGTRPGLARGALAVLLIGAGTWAAVVWTDAGGLWLVALSTAAWVGGAFAVDPAREGARAALASVGLAATAAVLAVAVLQPLDTTTSFRTAYWQAALAEARARPLLGSGAGSFHLTWERRGPEALFVRDAHSLYVEALSELGPLGLVLTLGLAIVPISAAIRRRGDPITAVAGAAFVLFAAHAGLDWDWEMPVVTLTGLGCAAVVLARSPSPKTHTID
jgi:O-antigen ligase